MNETKEKDLNVGSINPSTTYYYSQDGSIGSTGFSKDDFEFNIYSSDFSKLNTLEPNTNYSFQELHSPDSMLFGQINRYLAIKSALYITATAIKENGYQPISYDTRLVKDIAIVYALNIYELSLITRKTFGTNIFISLPKVRSIFEYNRGITTLVPIYAVTKSVNRFMCNIFGT